MNMTLLILGVLLILFSIILIIINTTDSSDKNFDTSIKEKTYEKVSEDIESISSDDSVKEEIIKVEDIEDEKIDLEDEILYKNFTEVKTDTANSINETENITDQIINMYTTEGLEVNEIAKKLKKGIREIEIILKVNEIKD